MKTINACCLRRWTAQVSPSIALITASIVTVLCFFSPVRAWDVTAAACLVTFHAGGPVVRMVSAPPSHGRGVVYLARGLRQAHFGFGEEAVVLFHHGQHRESDETPSEHAMHSCRFDVVKAVVNVAASDVSKRKGADAVRQLVTRAVLPKAKGLCVGLAALGRWLVIASPASLFLWPHDVAVDEPQRYSAGKLIQSKICSVAVHPDGAWVSVGDIRGRIHHIQCIPEDASLPVSQPVVSSKHWHSREVCSVAYGSSGAYMLSGGHEGVLVIWQTDSGNASFLPRLGAPIRCVSVSQSVTGSHPLLYAVSLVSNAVIGIDAASMKVLWTVRGLAISGYQGQARSLIGRLVTEPRTGCLVLDGVPNSGQLQMFDPLAGVHVGSVEVLRRNYVSKMHVKTHHMMQLSKESQVASSSDVSVIACDFTHDGKWMMTLDATSPNHSLKFWSATASVDAFTLNTQVDNPHKDVPIVLRCHPRLPLVVTAARDHSFKLWELATVSAVPSASGIAPPSTSEPTADVWKCRSVGFYKDVPVTAGCFSGDGSCLAIAYSHIITLWSPFSNTLKATLTHPCPDEPVM
jgi:NET1-associated nuclear protein 1 (U3 small nucleolar RNA-associated protein 17)